MGNTKAPESKAAIFSPSFEQNNFLHSDQNQNIALYHLLAEGTHTLDVERINDALNDRSLLEFDTLIQQARRQIHNETLNEDLANATPEELEKLRQQLTTLDSALSENPPPKFRNIYSHMVAFYSLVNETLANLKNTNNQQKRDDKEDVKVNQNDKTRYTWCQCTLEMLSGAIAGCLAATSDFGRVAAEFGVSKIVAGGNAVLQDKSQRKEHTIQTLDKKLDSGRDRNQGLGRLDQDILRNISEAMRSHQRTLVDRNING